VGLRGHARAARLFACLLLAGVVACGDDDSSAAKDAGRDGGDEPQKDSGPPDPKPDASDPEPDAATDAGNDGGDEPNKPEPDAGEPEPDAGEPEPDAGPALTLGGLTVSVSPEDHDLDLFGVRGHRFWIEISEEQVTKQNEEGWGGGGGNPDGDIYFPGSNSSNATYADHVLVENAETQEVADYGKVEVDLVGESTFRRWDESHIPNVRIDTNEFDKDTRIGTYEHMRLNNGLVGSIFRESLAHSIYRSLGYPALRSSHAFLGSNVWGDDIWVPMSLMEMYKRRFCRDNQDLIGGSCENMWEFVGDLDGGYVPPPATIDQGRVPQSWCQVSDCDNTRLIETMDAIALAPRGEGFKAALNDYIDWDRFHELQCLNWIMWVGDDPLHNNNNNLIIERDTDHKLVWAPYSVDISAGQDWYTNTPLLGENLLSTGCQSEPECWADTVATCEDVIMRFDELNPEEMVDDLVTQLTDLDMMRYGDDERAEQLRQWFVDRQEVLMDELEIYRVLPDEFGNCPGDMIRCGDGGCGTEQACEDRECLPGLTLCETTGQCLPPDYHCIECAAEEPFFCAWQDTCTPNQQACIDTCNSSGDYFWCESYDACIYYQYYCPDDTDGGIGGEGGFGGSFAGVGGVGGFAGFGMGGFPGGFAGFGPIGGAPVPGPVGGMGVIIDEGP
jgi:hypothetical protein